MLAKLPPIKQNQDITLQQESQECERTVKSKQNTEEIERKDHLQVKQVRNNQNRDKMFSKTHDKNQEIKRMFCMRRYTPEAKLSGVISF